jgi:hypothetical protein
MTRVFYSLPPTEDEGQCEYDQDKAVGTEEY